MNKIKIWFQNRRAKDRKVSKKKRNETSVNFLDSSKSNSLANTDGSKNSYNADIDYTTKWQMSHVQTNLTNNFNANPKQINHTTFDNYNKYWYG